MLERIFRLKENRTSPKIEVLAGFTTFMTMAYILFVNPAILSKDFAGNPTGLTHDAVLFATCIAACVGCVLMGLLANYPIALAPGMGENFFFVSVVMGLSAAGFSHSWKVALGLTFIAGVLFLVLSSVRIRAAIIDGVSPSLKNGIAVGIGIFIAFIGMRNAGVVLESPGTAVRLNPQVTDPRVLIFLAGLLITGTLTVLHVRGAILWGIFANTIIALGSGQQVWRGTFGFPKEFSLFAFDFHWMFHPETYMTMFPYILIFLFMDVFDTTGTLIGISEQAGFLVDNRLPRAQQAFYSDALATMAGSCVGTSTVTAYIESATGVAAGGRTGLASVTTGILFFVALFFTPLVQTVGSYPPITAPALLLVGCMMARNMTRIDWSDPTESIPAFLIMIGIPFFYNISDGLALGFVVYPVLKLLTGRARQVSPLLYVVAFLFIIRYVCFPS